jgi:RIO kinase 1
VPLHDAEPVARPAPDWLPTDDVEDEVVGLLKTGKEAEVFVVERRSRVDGRSCLLAHKRYRPAKVTHKGELEALGFTRARAFTDDVVYHEGRRFRRTRDERAVGRMTDYGKRLLNDRWPGHELSMLERLWDAGADVPYPVEFVDDGMLMQYVGDESQAAPRLAVARLEPAALVAAFDQLVANLRTFLEVGIVHADLSPFNVLWWDERLWFIDFPQAVDLVLNPHGFDLLHHDVLTMCSWFARRGVDHDPEELFADLLSSAF